MLHHVPVTVTCAPDGVDIQEVATSVTPAVTYESHLSL